MPSSPQSPGNLAAPAATGFAVPPDARPRHIAIIMDGNGRWAEQQGKPRIEGHRQGVASVRRVVEECVSLGIEQVTLYCLSSENWKRPPQELNFLLSLLEQYMIEERTSLNRQGVRMAVIGRREGLTPGALREMDKTVDYLSGNTGTLMNLAINYGSRGEIVDATREIARKVHNGELAADDIDEAVISDHLYTAGMPDPDLLIRTAGEMRISNYLLWQISYAELWVTQKCWPDFDGADLQAAIQDYAARTRRFGGLPT